METRSRKRGLVDKESDQPRGTDLMATAVATNTSCFPPVQRDDGSHKDGQKWGGIGEEYFVANMACSPVVS